jgi:transposase
MTLIVLPSRSPELNPVEQIWQYLRANWLSSRVFETCVDVVDAACDAWRRLVAVPEVITSIGTCDWAHIGQK